MSNKKQPNFLFVHTWVARATLENGPPEQHACSLKGTGFLSAVGCPPVEPGASPPIPLVQHWKDPRALETVMLLKQLERKQKQYSWEKQSTLKCLQLENKACKVCTKKSLYLTVFQPQFLQGAKGGLSWLTLADKLCSLPAQLHTLLTGHQ